MYAVELDSGLFRVYYCIGTTFSSYVASLEEMMATAGKVVNLEVDALERGYMTKGLEGLRASLQRSIVKETSQEIVAIRKKEIESITALLLKIGGV